MSDEKDHPLPTSDELATKIFWITIVGAVLFGAAVFFFVLNGDLS